MSTLGQNVPGVVVPVSPPPVEIAPAPAEDLVQRVYVWSLPLRLMHWTLFFSVAVLAATGFYIGSPFLTVTGEARQHFFMGTVRVVHFWAAFAFTLALLARMYWLVGGNRHERWDQFVPVAAERRRDMFRTFLFYAFIRRDAPPVVGHNPLAGFIYIAVYGLCFVMVLTGFGLYAMSTGIHSPFHGLGFLADVFGGAQTTRWIHHIVMWLLLGFVVHHVYSGLLMSVSERTGTMESIFSGYKYVKKGDR
jgi:Ni/Fe-hydrogenase 1 B-type cytochrome subunit